MKTLITTIIVTIFPLVLNTQDNEALCNYISKELKEKPILCIDKSKINANNEIYQFYKWTAFKDDYFVRIEKNNNNYFLVQKKMTKHHYNQETGEEYEAKIEIIVNRKLSKVEILNFKKIIGESKIWENSNYHVEPICNDGWGIFVYAIKKNNFIELDNGSCSPKDEFLNNIYDKLKISFNLK